jgi:hypothetical protein
VRHSETAGCIGQYVVKSVTDTPAQSPKPIHAAVECGGAELRRIVTTIVDSIRKVSARAVLEVGIIKIKFGADNKLSNQQLFSDFMIDGVKCGPDGVRCDIDGNLWVSSNGNPGGRGLGYSGVTVWTPEGKLIGRIRIPEVTGNICARGIT